MSTIGVIRRVLHRLSPGRPMRWFDRQPGSEVGDHHFGAIFQGAHDAILIVCIRSERIVDANPRACELLGYTREDLLDMSVSTVHPFDMVQVREFARSVSRNGWGWTEELTCTRKDGSRIPAEVSASIIESATGDCMLALVRDARERKREEQGVRRALTEKAARRKRRLHDVLEGMRDGFINVEGDRIDYVNHSAARVIGLSPGEAVGRKLLDVLPLRVSLEELRQAGREDRALEMTCGRGGAHLCYEVRAFLTDAGFSVFIRDVTEHRKVDELRHRLAAFPRLNPNPVVELSESGELLYVNEVAAALGGSAGAASITAVLPPDYLAIVARCVATGEPVIDREVHFGDRTITWSFIPVSTAPVVHAYAFDITDRLHLEERLRQSQKLEAIGQLAGGIAHDFNNLLTTMGGNTGLLLDQIDDAVLRDELEDIHLAVERAKALTGQLLAFSRRQVVQPQTLDLNEVIADLQKMLDRLIGEDVSLETHLTDSPVRVHLDPGQIQQVILNLAINARDAMRSGGSLRIATRILTEGTAGRDRPGPPGHRVLLCVSDTGVGMDRAMLEHIFEPFFTTKPPGEGTGLGLATVYGIVEQASGFIEVESEPGVGTEFRVYLPQATEAASSRRPPEPASPVTMDGGSATILVIEDEDAVRSLVEKVLKRSGYDVLTAGNGLAALRVADDFEGTVDLVITDIVMPEMGGPAVAERLREARPDTRILFMSGYSDGAIFPDGITFEGEAFLQKPFSPSELILRVRQALSG